MLAEFKVRNYKNFRDELCFSLESGKNYEFNQQAVRNGIIKDAVIVGYNAFGKTNLGRAIMDIITHLTDKKKQREPFVLYSNLYNQNEIVSFAYKFKFVNCPADGNIYMLWTRLKKDDYETNVIDVLKEMSLT